MYTDEVPAHSLPRHPLIPLKNSETRVLLIKVRSMASVTGTISSFLCAIVPFVPTSGQLSGRFGVHRAQETEAKHSPGAVSSRTMLKLFRVVTLPLALHGLLLLGTEATTCWVLLQKVPKLSP